MGYALAKIAMLRGADVTLVTGKTYIKKPDFVKIVEAVSYTHLGPIQWHFTEKEMLILKAVLQL